MGIGFWSEGEGGEIYGCLIYNNGWKAPDRGHGHGIYTQNERGTKLLVDNVLFNQFGYGIHAYGSSKAKLAGFHLEGNVAFNSGCLSGSEERASNILVGGGTRAERISIVSNYTYHTNLAGTSSQFGYGPNNDDLTLKDNYLAGYVRVLPWERVTATGNTFVGLTSLVEMHVPSRETLKGYEWDRNTYLSGEVQYQPLSVVAGKENISAGWQQWQQKAGLDRNGMYVRGRPSGTAVFVRPNKYETGRANVVVYNWDHKPHLEVDLKDVLKLGQAFRIVSAQDFYGETIGQGKYEGKPVVLPMTPHKPVAPVGLDNTNLPVTEPEFGVFVVLPE